MDFNQLRPIDDNATPGDALLYWYPNTAMMEPELFTFIHGQDSEGYFVCLDEDGEYRFGTKPGLWYAPLCWVEGRPVYKGDVLYWKDSGEYEEYAADYLYDGAEGYIANASNTWLDAADLTWQKPKVKKEVWVVLNTSDTSSTGFVALPYPYATREAAVKAYPDSQIHCVEVEV